MTRLFFVTMGYLWVATIIVAAIFEIFVRLV